MPIQSAFASKSQGTVEVFEQYIPGLKDLEGFSHIILIYHFHMSKDFSLQVKPFLEDKVHGVFAVRAPNRPNHIGISVVRLESVRGNVLDVSGLDVIDDTPLLDIKPYIPDFDAVPDAVAGWYDNVPKEKERISDERFDK